MTASFAFAPDASGTPAPSGTTEVVTIAGTPHETWRIHALVTVATTYNGQPVTVKVDQTQWLATDTLLGLKQHQIIHITYDNAPVGDSDVTSILESTTPSAS